MRAVVLVSRSLLRRRIWGSVGLVVLVGIATGAVLSAAAGARRTASAFPDLLDDTKSADLVVIADEPIDTAALTGVDGVTRANAAMGFGLAVEGPDGLPDFEANPGAQAGTNRLFSSTQRPLLLAGRLPDPERDDEILVNEQAASRFDLHPGDRRTFAAFNLGQLNELFSSIPEDAEPTAADFDALRALLTPVEVTVAGVGRLPAEVVANEDQYEPLVQLTPAFAREHADLASYHVAYLDLDDPEAPHAALDDALRAEGATELQRETTLRSTVGRAVGPYHDALALFALVAGLTSLVVMGQAVIRQALADSAELTTLEHLGMTRHNAALATATRTVAASAAGVLLGVVVAVLASPLFPIGPARRAAPDAGVAVDGRALAGGAAIALATFTACALLATWRQAARPSRCAQRPSRALAWIESARPSSPTVIGVRFALQPADRAARSARTTTIVGLATAVAAVLASVALAASLDAVVTTPAAYGWTWDARFETYENGLDAHTEHALRADERIEHVTIGARSPVVLDGRSVAGYGFSGEPDDPRPAVTDGRLPTTPDEVAVGAATLRDLGKDVGDVVEVTSGGRSTLTIVGRTLTPSLSLDDPYGMSDNAVFTLAGLDRAAGGAEPGFALVDLTAPASPGLVDEIAASYEGTGTLLGLQRPGDIVALDGVRRTPALLAGLLAVLGLGVLVHALLVSVRSGRRPLATLRAVGFTRRQIRQVVGHQASALTIVALVAAVPIGLVAGGWCWSVLADRLGVDTEVVIPIAPVVLIIAATLVLANIISSAVARAGGALLARSHPASALRTE